MKEIKKYGNQIMKYLRRGAPSMFIIIGDDYSIMGSWSVFY